MEKKLHKYIDHMERLYIEKGYSLEKIASLEKFKDLKPSGVARELTKAGIYVPESKRYREKVIGEVEDWDLNNFLEEHSKEYPTASHCVLAYWREHAKEK